MKKRSALSMDRVHRTLINLVSLGRVPLHSLYEYSEFFNAPPPGTPSDVLRGIAHLLGAGLLSVTANGARQRREAVLAALAAPTREQLYAGSYYYGLTRLGGEEWERTARPRWRQFLDDATVYEPPQPVRTIVRAAERLYAEQYVRSRYGGEVWDRRSERTESHFRATYWKVLKSGYEFELPPDTAPGGHGKDKRWSEYLRWHHAPAMGR